MILTIVTQIGGIVFWVSFGCVPWIKSHTSRHKILGFFVFQVVLYLGVSLLLIPTLAGVVNEHPRKALPLFATRDFPIKPRTIFYCLFNRHYLEEKSLSVVRQTALEMNSEHSGSFLIYYDANFPFEWTKLTAILKKIGLVRFYVQYFPLYPHLSHWDGKKLDLGFFYKKNELEVNYTPSWIGYGALEAPLPGEVNVPCMCKAYWNYNFWMYLRSKNPCEPEQAKPVNMQLDRNRTQKALLLFLNKASVKSIILETHLAYRFEIGGRTRLAGCQATRHDDHFHVEFY